MKQILQNFKVEYDHEDIGCILRLVNVPDKPLRFKFIDLPWFYDIYDEVLHDIRLQTFVSILFIYGASLNWST